MLPLLIASALAKEPSSPEVAAAFVATPPDLASCFEGVEGHFTGEAAIVVTVGADGKVTKVAVDHADATFPEDCGLSVMRELTLPAGERTFGVLVEKSVDRTVVTYGDRLGRLRLEAITAPKVLACALATPSETPDPALGAVVQYAIGPVGKVATADVAFGGFTGDALKTCVLTAYKTAKVPKNIRDGAIIVWEPLRWTTDDVQ